jgi:hypothetical protein
MTRRSLYLILVFALGLAPAFAQKKKDADDKLRSVQGVVMSTEESPVQGAVVQLKDSKTLRIRSFISKEDGSYYFHGLDPDVDYSLKAEHQGLSSATRTLSSFDSRKKPVINLKLEKQ